MAASSPARRRLGTSGVVVTVLAVQALANLAVGLVPTVTVTAVAFVLSGATSGMWNVATISLRQRIVPDALLGRVTSAYRLIGLGAMPVGAAAGGLIARSYGLPAPFLVAGVLLLMSLLAALRWLPRSVVEQAEASRAGRVKRPPDARFAAVRRNAPTARRAGDVTAYPGT